MLRQPDYITIYMYYVATSLHCATVLAGPGHEPFHRKYTARSITRDCISLSIISSLVSFQHSTHTTTRCISSRDAQAFPSLQTRSLPYSHRPSSPRNPTHHPPRPLRSNLPHPRLPSLFHSIRVQNHNLPAPPLKMDIKPPLPHPSHRIPAPPPRLHLRVLRRTD